MIVLNINWEGALTTTFGGIAIGFIALIIMVICFELLDKFMTSRLKSKKAKQGIDVNKLTNYDLHVPAGDTAAIAMALHLYFNDFHEEESNVITIKRIERRYSPWSSKIYGINTYVK
jgi:glutaconyl-CoA/methylmalonyl-CoA decarboxylase subunit delta